MHFKGPASPLAQGFPLHSNEHMRPLASCALAAVHPWFGLLARAESMFAFLFDTGERTEGSPCTT